MHRVRRLEAAPGLSRPGSFYRACSGNFGRTSGEPANCPVPEAPSGRRTLGGSHARTLSDVGGVCRRLG